MPDGRDSDRLVAIKRQKERKARGIGFVIVNLGAMGPVASIGRVPRVEVRRAGGPYGGRGSRASQSPWPPGCVSG